MSQPLNQFIAAVFRANDLQVPYFDDGLASVLTFLKGTLEADVHLPNESPGAQLNRAFNRRLLEYSTEDGTQLSDLLITPLKPLLARSSAFERSLERHLLSSCLMYALHLKPRISVAQIEQLLTVFSDVSSFIQPRDAADAFWECTRTVMFAALQTFLPEESGQRAAEDADESLLEGLAVSPTLAQHFQDPMRLVLQFAYVLLQVRCNNRAARSELQAKLDVCYKVGVFSALKETLTDRVFTQNFSDADQLLCFEIAFRLLTMFLEVESRRFTSSAHILHKNTIHLAEHHSLLNPKGDDFCTLMECLALVFEKCPNVIVSHAAEAASVFLSWIPDSKLIRRSSAVMTRYIRVVSALATGESGANRVFTQLVEGARKQFSSSNDDFKYISLDFILQSLMKLCDALIRHSGKQRLGILSEEADGFVVYLNLLGKLFHNESQAAIAEMILLLESEFSAILRNESLRDIVLLIFCKPVPPELKAAACDVLSGIGRAPGVSTVILKNLQCVGLFATETDTRRVNRNYLQSQLASIEAPLNDYTCTISTLKMINTLLIRADALPDRDTAMVEVTYFCRDVVLDAIWKHLRFEKDGQQWELLSVVFEHFLICLERIDVDNFSSTPQKISPGQFVLHDVLNQGMIYKALRLCAAKIYHEHSSQYFSPNSANHAILNMLDLLLAIFQSERHVMHPPPGGYRPFKEVFLGDKDFVQKTLFSVDCALPSSIQIASVELMRQLFGTTPHLMSNLDEDVQDSILRALRLIYTHSLQF